MTRPEERARHTIDALLQATGWHIQDPDAVNLRVARGVAVREFPLTTGFADYLLFVDRKAIGAVEAKAVGIPLSGVEAQSAKYSAGLPDVPPAWRTPLPFLYESTGVETFFTNGLDPEPRSRRVFAFHRPETLAQWISEPATLRTRLRHLPPLNTNGLWSAQIEAITNLEQSLAADRPRALIQMATGSGKTFTAVNFIYRLIKFANARRVLFLVDRGNLGRQTLKEFQQFVTPDDGRKFTELYNVQHLQSNTLDDVSRVCITTIQRLYSILRGEQEFAADLEEQSLFELDGGPPQEEKQVSYNGQVPIEYFDIIVTDECHRSIYNQWRQVLEYFDAHLIGLTATPSKQTFGFFGQNLVMEYSRQRAVADGVNVDGQVYRIRTAITEGGGNVEAGYVVDKRDRQTRAVRWQQLDQELTYGANQLDRDVVSEGQIRLVLRTFRDRLFTELFPERTDVPKTLIFAKDDSHAEDIVRIVREEFGKGNDFCQKITYRTHRAGKKADDLINDFRNSYYPRIAVTVDMIATGTDIKPLEVLLFMRAVKSRVLWEQMLGRGTRVVNATDLQAVTPDAHVKDHFVIVDAVGVVDNPKADTQSLDRKRSVPFEKLLSAVALGATDDDTLSSLAGRLARLDRTLTTPERYAVSTASAGKTLRDLANNLLDALDPDLHLEAARQEIGHDHPTLDQIHAAAECIIDHAVAPFADPDLRTTLTNLQQRSEQTIDRVSVDELREAGFDAAATEQARATVTSFAQFIAEHRDEITALQILYNQPHAQQRLTFPHLKELDQVLRRPPHNWSPDALWQAYAQVERVRVRGMEAKRTLTDLVALVRHAVQRDDELVPYVEQVRARYQRWLDGQAAAGRTFTPEQRWWLDQIAQHVGVNLEITPDDLDYGEFFNRGGRIGAMRSFGSDWLTVLHEVNAALAA